MSRGPGRHQRRILEVLATLDPDVGVTVTHPDQTPAQQNALRRAAYRLADVGMVELDVVAVGGVRRLSAFRGRRWGQYRAPHPVLNITLPTPGK